MADSSDNNQRLGNVVESVYLKLITRIGMPILLAILGYLGSQELNTIRDALNVIPQIVTEQKITSLKLDQMQKDLSSTAATVYSRDEAQKDWKIQAQSDELIQNSIKDHEKRINTLETKILK